MGLHEPFGYLKYKLWPKEGSKIKQPDAFPSPELNPLEGSTM